MRFRCCRLRGINSTMRRDSNSSLKVLGVFLSVIDFRCRIPAQSLGSIRRCYAMSTRCSINEDTRGQHHSRYPLRKTPPLTKAYHVDPNGNHDGCMQAFSEAGIYLFLDVDTFDTMINQTSPSWPASSYTAFTKVIDAFDKYDNMAGFFISNEVFSLIIVTDFVGSKHTRRIGRGAIYKGRRSRHKSIYESEGRTIYSHGLLRSGYRLHSTYVPELPGLW